MEAPEKLSSDEQSERAEKFYDQALLLVDCCKIPEAIKLFEKACQLKPSCEVYKETLDFFQSKADLLDNKQQGLSYASVSRPKPSCGKAEQKSYSAEWNVKKARGKVPEVSTCYYSHADEQATIDNPWASYVSRSHRKRSTPSSPIDGLTEIDLPQMSENMWYSSGSQSLKQDYDRQDRDEVDSFFSSSLNTPISSQEALNEDSSVCDHKQENHSDDTVDAFVNQREECPEECYEDSGNYEEDVDSRFLDELCAARETFLDDWAKYYDVLNRDLKEESPCSESGVLNQGVSTPLEYSDSFDDAKSIKDKKKINHSGKEKSNSEKPESKISCDVCANCGQSKEGRTQPCNAPKNRIHFVNGTCISSANSPISNCTCNRKHSVKGIFKGKSGKTPLSTSQQEFYQNLQNYFGSGAVKSVKTDSKVKKESSSGGMDANCATNLNSSSLSNEPSKVKSSQNVAESNECNAKASKHSDDFASKEQLIDGVEGLRSSFSEDGVVKDKTSFDEGRFHQESFSEGRKVGDNVDNNTKASVNTEHVKSSKERTDSHWRSRFKAGVKSKVSHRAKSIDPAETRKPSNAHVKERSRLKPRTERTVHAEFDLSKLTSGLYCTGVAVLSKSGQAVKSIFYYVLLLLALLFGFFIYCSWFAGCWACRRTLSFVPVGRWLAEGRKKLSTLFEFRRKQRERRSTYSDGQTYDLPKNGDAAVMHMLQNKDSDPYSVLGVPRDATDDDIRKQYRKLAVLIHPDKNTHPQADEAFKTLANAFDILSDPEKRANYDAEAAWRTRAEERKERYGGHTSPEQFFADLGKKMEEMHNSLHCNVCDGKHRRYNTKRFILTARFCSRCNTRHAAKEGDLWAESSFLGYKLHFYACMEGEIFDVTEWAACQGIGRVEANPHTVHLKLKTRQTQQSSFNSRSEEREFENFMRAFFGQFGPEGDKFQGANKQRKKKKKKKH
ncbi:uncharacterized protein [Pocillopora verrucosa]|uniref:uncharacterized protein n=1 Tax=Pocillopora verrucosa TaxID=203993 RepID=UPI00333EDA84